MYNKTNIEAVVQLHAGMSVHSQYMRFAPNNGQYSSQCGRSTTAASTIVSSSNVYYSQYSQSKHRTSERRSTTVPVLTGALSIEAADVSIKGSNL